MCHVKRLLQFLVLYESWEYAYYLYFFEKLLYNYLK